MAFNMFPRTNFHEQNDDWLIKICKEALAHADQALSLAQGGIDAALIRYIDEHFADIMEQAIYNDQTETITLSILPGTSVEVDPATKLVKHFVVGGQTIDIPVPEAPLPPEPVQRVVVGGGKPLTSGTFRAAWDAALAKSRFLYIPACEINMDQVGVIESLQDVDIACDPRAVFSRIDGADPLFRFIGCSVKISGMTVKSGTNINSLSMLYRSFSAGGQGEHGALLYFDHCDGVELSDITCPISRHPGVVRLMNCDNVWIHDCMLQHLLEDGIGIRYSGSNICIERCTISDVRIPTSPGGIYYCYGISTGGGVGESGSFAPPDRFTVRSCLVERTEDSGIDTHGASNVLIEGNIILDTTCAITAYNDAPRVNRPAGWKMRNVRIIGNFCSSDRVNDIGAHPYVLTSCGSKTRVCENLTIEGNYFSSPNHTSEYGNFMIPINGWTNVSIHGNTFDGRSTVNTAIALSNCNAIVTGNTFTGFNYSVYNLEASRTEYKHNTPGLGCPTPKQSTSMYNYMDSDETIASNYRTVRKNATFLSDDKSKLYVSSTTGITVNPQASSPLTGKSYQVRVNGTTITSSDGSDLPFFPELNITVGGSYTIFITEVVSTSEYRFYRAGSRIPNGTYEAHAGEASLKCAALT